MSRCSRSCPPLSWGWDGRPRSRSIPKATHHADKRLKPYKACTLAKGAPLSERIASGKPYLAKIRSKASRTVWLRALSSARSSSRYRLNSSRTVKVSHRPASPKRHHPLKSTVHTSLGVWPRRPLLSRPPSTGPSLTRRGCVKPTCSRIRLKLLSLGVACPCRRWYNVRILRGPQCRCTSLSFTISHTCPSLNCLGLLRGRRESSSSPSSPWRKNLSRHL